MSSTETGLDAIEGVRTFAPGSDGYKQATSPRNSVVKQRPLFVATPTSIDQVAVAVRHAAAAGLRVVPQATGHGAASDLGDDVLLLDTSGLNAVQIDAGRRIARVGAGATWGAVDSAAEKVGLLGRAGSAPDVAVSGFTFGGGAGWLTRPYGLAAGALIAVDFVDGAGNVRRAADDAPDEVDRAALWAYRGGGGVGIAARLEFELAPVDDLWAGFLLWPIEALDAVVSAWAHCVPRFGAALATSIAVLRAPSGPPIPRTLQGQQIVHLTMASSRGEGDAAALRQALADVPTPLLDTWGPADAAKLGGIHLDPSMAVPSLGIARWLDDATPSIAAGTLSSAIGSPILMIELRHVSNTAPAREGAASTVAGGFMMHAVGDAAETDGIPKLEAAFAAVRQASAGADTGLTIGSWADGRSAVPDALPAHVRERVIDINKMVDPNGVLAPSRFIVGDDATDG